MTTASTRREQLASSLRDKGYRDAFVADQIQIGVPLQIKKLRDDRELTQEALGTMMTPPMKQESVWRLENPNKANLTIGTLLRVASAFDVALIVRFAPFSELIDSTPWLAGRSTDVPAYADDMALHGSTIKGRVERYDFVAGGQSPKAATQQASGKTVIEAVKRFRPDQDLQLQDVA